MTTGTAIFVIGAAALVLIVIAGVLGLLFARRQWKRFDEEWGRASRRFDERKP